MQINQDKKIGVALFLKTNNVTIYYNITGPLKKLFHYVIFQKFFHIFIIH